VFSYSGEWAEMYLSTGIHCHAAELHRLWGGESSEVAIAHKVESSDSAVQAGAE